MNNYNKRTAHLLIYLGIFMWGLYYYTPGIVFYYDHEISKGEISNISQKRVYVDYFHEELDQDISAVFREGNKLNLKKLEVGKEIQVRYSKKFPSEISIVNYHKSPGLGGLVMMFMLVSPLLLFRWIKF